MKNLNDEEFGRLLRNAVRPVGDPEPSTDLWPRMLRRMDAGHARFSWIDWVLAALAVLLCIFVPEALPGLLYHL